MPLSLPGQHRAQHHRQERADKAELKPPALDSAWQFLTPQRFSVTYYKELDQSGLAWIEEHHPEKLGSAQGTAASTVRPSSRCGLHPYFLGFQPEKM